MNVLVLGGAGFLGTNLALRLSSEPTYRVVVVDSLEPRLRSSFDALRPHEDAVRLVRGDVRERAVLEELLPGQHLVFNCAAQTSHILSIEEPELDFQLNCVASLRVLEAARVLNPVALYCYVSTSTVVGRGGGEPIDERTLERPLDLLSAHKAAAENHHRIYARVHGLRTTVVRFANLYGPYGKPYPEFGFVNYFVSLARAGADIEVYGEGGQRRNLMHVDDAVEALLAVARDARDVGETFFAAHDEHHSVRAIAERIVAAFGRGRVVTRPWPETRKRIDVEDVRVSSERLRALTGWRPRYSLDEGLARTRAALESAP